MIERFDPRVWSIECLARLLAGPERWWVDLAWAEFRAAPAATQRAIAVRVERLARRSAGTFERWDRIVRARDALGRPRARLLERRGRQRLAADPAGAQVDFERALELYEASGRFTASARLRVVLARVLAAQGRTFEAAACAAAAHVQRETW